MALSFSTQLNSAYFTSEIPDVTIATTSTYVDFTIARLRHDTHDTFYGIFTTRYYAVNGVVSVLDIHTILENYLQVQQKSAADFCFFVETDTERLRHNMTIVFCKSIPQGLSASEMIQRHFFTSVYQRFITPDAVVPLYYYIPYNPSLATPGSYRVVTYKWRIVILLENGHTETVTQVVRGRAAGWGLQRYDLSLPIVIDLVGSSHGNFTVVSFSVDISDRRTTFYVDRRHSQRQFYFRNAFNVWELAIIPASQKSKVESESSMALCGDTFIPYDIQHTRTFEVQTASLLLAQARWFEQLVTSPEIRIRDIAGTAIDDLPQILIVDYDYEIDDAPGAVNAFRFTWKYADKRSYINLSYITAGVFSEQFTPQFL